MDTRLRNLPSKISIHSLVKRETPGGGGTPPPPQISIHSLVKRETAESKDHWENARYFNPLPRKEGDENKMRYNMSEIIFQSTPS